MLKLKEMLNPKFTPYCSVYDQAVPGNGPPGLVSAPAPS